MTDEETKILKYNQRQKSIKHLFVIYVDFEAMLEKIDSCENNPKEPYTLCVNKHTPCGFSISIKFAPDSSKNKSFFISLIVWKKFVKSQKNDTTEINYFEQKMSVLCVKELQFRQSKKICNIYI